MRGLLIGRFQPFHKGHKAIVDQLESDVDELVICIGSAERSHTEKNPFTAGERMEMIHAALPDTIVSFIVPITDIPSNAKWVAHIVANCPRFHQVYSNNPLVEQLFTEENYPVTNIPLIDREHYQGTVIRERMLDGDPWEPLVPTDVARIISDIDGVDRLNTITRTDTPST